MSVVTFTEEEEISEDTIQEYQEAFRLFDKDGDGTITGKDLQAGMRSLGVSLADDELKRLLRTVGSHENGVITFKEFLEIIRTIRGDQNGQSEVKRAFKLFDADGDGYLGVDDLKRALAKMGEAMNDAEVREMIRMADLDKDGLVNFQEFSQMLDRIS